MVWPRAVFTAAALGLLWSSQAQAAESEVDATFDAQFYTVTSPFGDPVVRRRRYTQTLGLSVYDVMGPRESGDAPELLFRGRLRLDSDFGQDPAERTPERPDRFVPGLTESPLDLMYAYLEGRRYFDGYVGFRLGRQFVIDSLGWWSFDGALLRLTTPAYVEFEALGGFEQRGIAQSLGTSRYEADGVYRGNRDELAVNDAPYFLEERRLAPAFGFAVQSAGLRFLQSRLSYRRVINRDRVLISPFADLGGGFLTVDGDRTSSELIGYSLRVTEDELGSVGGDVVYDIFSQIVSEYEVGIDWYTSSRLSVGASYDYYLPTFDGDSIFNWFTHLGSHTGVVRSSISFDRRFDVAGEAGVISYETEGDPDATPSADPNAAVSRQTAFELDALGRANARYRLTDASFGLSGDLQTGERGHRVGGTASARKLYDQGYYDSLILLSVYDWSDALRPTRDATSFSYVLGAGISPDFDRVSRLRFGAEWEHSMNRLVGHRFRMLFTLALAVTP